MIKQLICKFSFVYNLKPMKKIKLFFALLFFVNVSLASADELFFDEVSFKQSFLNITEVERFVQQNPNYSEVNQELLPASFHAVRINSEGVNPEYEFLGLDPFLFSLIFSCTAGCLVTPFVAGPLAWLLVYVDSDHDKLATRKALNGCLVSNGISLFFFLGYWALIAASGF